MSIPIGTIHTVFVAALIALLPLTTVDIASNRHSDAIVAGAVKGMSVQDFPKDELGIRTWRGEENGVVVSIAAVRPNPDPDEDVDVEGPLKKEIARDQKMVADGAGRSMTLDRNGIKVRLFLGYDIYGNLRATESCEKPVLYRRTITAKADSVDEAEAILTTLTIRNEAGERINIYPRGIPRGWTAGFGDKKVQVPRPQDLDKFESAVGTAYMQTWGDFSSKWYVFDFFRQFDGTPKDLVKAGIPHPDSVGPNPKVTESDAVTWDGLKLVRIKGTAGQGETAQDWIAWYTRTDSGKLGGVLAVRTTGKSWPADLPFDPAATGEPITDSTWPEVNAKVVRTVTADSGASISLLVYGRPTKSGQNVSFFASATEAYEVLVGPDAEKTWRECDPEKAWQPPRFGPAGLIDAAKLKIATGGWLLARQLIPSDDPRSPKVRRFEMLYTVQKGTPFLVWMVGWDNDSFRNAMRETIMSVKGSDGQQLLEKYPFTGVDLDYYAPFHEIKQGLNIKGPIATTVPSKYAFRFAGWTLSDDNTRLIFEFNHDKPELGSLQRKFGEEEGFKRYEKESFRFGTVKVRGSDMGYVESEWDKDHIRYTFTSVQIKPGAILHFLRVWKSSDKAWRDYVAKL